LSDLFDRNRLFAGLIFTNQIEFETSRRFLKHSLRRLGLLEKVLNLGKLGDVDDDRPAEQGGNFVDNDQVARVGHSHNESVSIDSQRNEVIPEHQIDLDRPEQLQIQVHTLQIDELIPIPFGKMLRSYAIFLFVFNNFFHPCTVLKLNIGMYSEINTAAIKVATNIKMIGSTQLNRAVDLIFTSSS